MFFCRPTFLLLIVRIESVLHCHNEKVPETGSKVLVIEHHKFGSIDRDSFAGVMEAIPAIDSLVLRNTSIEHLAGDSFASLSSLKCLDLTWNKLIKIAANGAAFRGIPSLQTLILSQNRIRVIQNSAFIYVGAVHSLDLSANQLDTYSLSTSAFRGLDALQYLNLDDNSLTHLSPLLLSHTPSLLELSIARNPLVTLAVYSLPLLHTFTAQNSLLTDFPRFPKSMNRIDLRESRLKDFADDRLPELQQLTSLKLSANPWHCSCENAAFMPWANASQLIVTDFENLTCSLPDLYRDKAFDRALADMQGECATSQFAQNGHNNMRILVRTTNKLSDAESVKQKESGSTIGQKSGENGSEKENKGEEREGWWAAGVAGLGLCVVATLIGAILGSRCQAAHRPYIL